MYCQNSNSIKINPIDGFAGFDATGAKIFWADADEFHMKKAYIEEEANFSSILSMVPIRTDDNYGIGFVAVV